MRRGGTKRLWLNRETLRELNPAGLAAVRGGCPASAPDDCCDPGDLTREAGTCSCDCDDTLNRA